MSLRQQTADEVQTILSMDPGSRKCGLVVAEMCRTTGFVRVLKAFRLDFACGITKAQRSTILSNIISVFSECINSYVWSTINYVLIESQMFENGNRLFEMLATSATLFMRMNGNNHGQVIEVDARWKSSGVEGAPQGHDNLKKWAYERAPHEATINNDTAFGNWVSSYPKTRVYDICDAYLQIFGTLRRFGETLPCSQEFELPTCLAKKKCSRFQARKRISNKSSR